MIDPKYESLDMQETRQNDLSDTEKHWNTNNENAVHYAYPKSFEALYPKPRVHRRYPDRVRHVRYPDILVNVETSDPD